ncbi:UNVERIFIED_CONTAM: hypothetical protein K2H54_024548 [Gekko kuhli]
MGPDGSLRENREQYLISTRQLRGRFTAAVTALPPYPQLYGESLGAKAWAITHACLHEATAAAMATGQVVGLPDDELHSLR